MAIERRQGIDIQRFHFGSTSELADWIKTLTPKPGGFFFQSDSGLRTLREGSTTYLPQAQKLIDRFNEEIPTLRRVWQPSIAGFFPNVPAYLTGEPESMWHMANDESDKAPIRVWVGVTSSASITNDDLIERGAALSAFAMALSERRPVLISPYWTLGNGGANPHSMTGGEFGNVVSWDMQSSPIVLSEVIPCLSDPNIIRYLGLDAGYSLDRRIPRVGPWFPNELNEQWMRECLGAADDDVWLPAIFSRSGLISNPIEWIKQQIAKHIGEEGE